MSLLLKLSLFTFVLGGVALSTMPDTRASQVTPRRAPSALATLLPAHIAGRAVPAGPPEAFPSPGTILVNQTFAHKVTPPNAFPFVNQTCLTAGVKRTAGSVPPCGSLAPLDPNGKGVLENTSSSGGIVSWVAYAQPVSTLFGVQLSFTIYSFDGDGADGQLLFFTDASQGFPTNIGAGGGSLGYTGGGPSGPNGLAAGYVGLGFDEHGTFSQNLPQYGLNGGPGNIAETVAARGAAGIGYYYLGGALNAQGQPSSLPFSWDQPRSQYRPSTGPTVFVTLSPTGYLTCAVDIHDGNGFITYYAQSIVGVAGQPPVPASVYVGVTGSTGALYNRHQIDDFFIWTP